MNDEKINAVLDAAESLLKVARALHHLRPALRVEIEMLCEATLAAREAQQLPCPVRMFWVEVSGGVAEVCLPAGGLPPGWDYELLDYDNLKEEIQTEAQFHAQAPFVAHRILQTSPYFLERIQHAERQEAEEAEKARESRRRRFVELAKDLTPDDYNELAAELAPFAEAVTQSQKGQRA